jgi:hypothetical protein
MIPKQLNIVGAGQAKISQAGCVLTGKTVFPAPTYMNEINTYVYTVTQVMDLPHPISTTVAWPAYGH